MSIGSCKTRIECWLPNFEEWKILGEDVLLTVNDHHKCQALCMDETLSYRPLNGEAIPQLA